MDQSFAETLRQRIVGEYAAQGYKRGWRLLYSPASVIDDADVAFIGLNPGGDIGDQSHAEFAMPHGSAYTHESWKGRPVGEEGLQRQVRHLFDRLECPAEDVLAGNLVPFRSSNWGSLEHRGTAVTFGTELWRDILDHARPRIIVAMGTVAAMHVRQLLDVREVEQVRVNWGPVTGTRGVAGGITFVGLPHLSRFPLFGRPESQASLDWLFRTSA
ncbi:MAG: hypothetical protein HY834_00340 [Devosia nanyangense]|uniref:Uracil-DNA glycosylase-like domain-containing protein n=1 Tax=Devosia nanyangense TaxID=1228055 RepID=A0A933L0W8_9HYPH|nr:hypothetical protein [Devosia nanyangense]